MDKIPAVTASGGGALCSSFEHLYRNHLFVFSYSSSLKLMRMRLTKGKHLSWVFAGYLYTSYLAAHEIGYSALNKDHLSLPKHKYWNIHLHTYFFSVTWAIHLCAHRHYRTFLWKIQPIFNMCWLFFPAGTKHYSWQTLIKSFMAELVSPFNIPDVVIIDKS